MYVSYLQLDKDPPMYQQNAVSGRHPGLGVGLGVGPQNFQVAPPAQYTDYASYHSHGLGADAHQGTGVGCIGGVAGGAGGGGAGASGWSPVYPPPPPHPHPAQPGRDEWAAHHYAAAAAAHAAAAAAAAGGGGSGAANLGFGPPPLPPEFGGQQHPPPPPLLAAPLNAAGGQSSGGSPQRRNAYDWIRRASTPLANPNGKTRTKDKYRVVYTDHQRLELEKEFHYSKYITIRRKAELASALSLSERQVKIWFQNRRAKERKISKKKQHAPASSSSGSVAMVSSSSSGGGGGGGGSSGLVSPSSLPVSIKEEF
ncbi:homeobox protein CDX-1b [Stigmatopora argus]